MRKDVTQTHCYATMRELFDAFKAFIDPINTDLLWIGSRLLPISDLDHASKTLGLKVASFDKEFPQFLT